MSGIVHDACRQFQARCSRVARSDTFAVMSMIICLFHAIEARTASNNACSMLEMKKRGFAVACSISLRACEARASSNRSASDSPRPFTVSQFPCTENKNMLKDTVSYDDNGARLSWRVVDPGNTLFI